MARRVKRPPAHPISPWLRPAMYASMKLLRDMRLNEAEHYPHLSAEDFLLLAAAGVASMGPLVEDPKRLEAYRREAHPPQELRGSLTQTDLVRITGLPRATVSRRVRQLMADGWFVRVNKHRLTTVPIRFLATGSLEAFARATYQSVNDYLDTIERLKGRPSKK